MRVFVSLEQRFSLHRDTLYVNAVYGYDFWQRYLEVFDAVVIVARVKAVDEIPSGWLRANGDRVSFIPVHYYRGWAQLIVHLVQLWFVAATVGQEEGAFILRVPGAMATLIWIQLLLRRKPFALEVVGDPYDSFSPHVWSWLIWPIRLLSAFVLKWQTHTASAGIAYVTREVLQKRYPSGRLSMPTYSISDVALSPNFFKTTPNTPSLKSPRLVFVGSLATLYKGQAILLRAVSRCVQDGLDLKLAILGGGAMQGYLENLASDLRIHERVEFTGHISDRQIVLEYLRNANLFVLPSYTEGVPRALLEAMACGLPCLASAVGGIPELLPPQDMIPPGSIDALVDKIESVLAKPDVLREMAVRNIRTAKAYRSEILDDQRADFYENVARLCRVATPG
jgi:glycosyltransferase involved in cell wall biosynthesis